MISTPTLSRIAAIALLAAAAMPLGGGIAVAADTAGTVKSLKGEAVAKGKDGKSRDLSESDPVFSGDVISTEADSAVGLTLADNSNFEIGPKATLALDEFVFNPAVGNGKLGARFLTGAFRYVSGKVAQANPQDVSLRTPVATIGIRGTALVAEVQPSSAGVALVEDPNATKPSSITVFNNAGSVVIDEVGFGTDVKGPNEAPTPPQRWGAERLQTVIGAITGAMINSIPRMPVMPGR